MKKIVGYITSDKLKNGYVSHQLQNQSIKYYLNSQQNVFTLSWTEYKDRAPQVLKSLLNETFYDGICFYSIEQLLHVANAKEILLSLKTKGFWVGFAREGMFFSGNDGFAEVLKLWWLIKNTVVGERPFSL